MKYFLKIATPIEGEVVKKLLGTKTKLALGGLAAGTGLYQLTKKPKREWNQGIIT